MVPVDALMPIGEFSVRSGLSTKRLRTYAGEGLLVPAAVDPSSGYRYYSPGQVRSAQIIDALRHAGMPLADIGEFLCRPSLDRLTAWNGTSKQTRRSASVLLRSPVIFSRRLRLHRQGNAINSPWRFRR